MNQAVARSGRDVVEGYYHEVLCDSCETNLDKRVGGVVAANWKCEPEQIGGDGPAGFAETMRFFRKFAPDLKYDIQEIIEAGNRYVVRSIVTGTPTEPFFGVMATKSFRINAVDIHDVVDGLIVHTYRVEDWARAIKQIA